MRDSCLWTPNKPSAGLAGSRKFFDELNDLGRDLQLQAQKVEPEARERKIKI
jgi:hypothetical protein